MKEVMDFASRERVEKDNLVIEGIPEIPERIQQRLNQYLNTRSASLQDWLPSGEGMLISTRFAETNQIHLVRAPGGARRQITFFDEPVGDASVCPNPEVNGFLFAKDIGGSEFYQIFSFDLDRGTYQMLTDGESRNGSVRWSNKGDRFAFHSTKRNGRDYDLYIGEIGNPGITTPILEEGGEWAALDWSPDDAMLLVLRYVSINESYLHILDVASKALTQFNPTDQRISYGSARFAKDGKKFYFTSDQSSEFRRLQYCDLDTGQIKVITDDIPWDVEGFVLSENGRHLAFTANEDGIGKLHLVDVESGEEEDLPQFPVGQIGSLKFSPDEAQLGMVLSGPQAAGDVYALDLSSKELVRWTRSEMGGLKSEDLVAPELIRYETFDEADGRTRMIPSFYYKPKGRGPFPVLIQIHGGPEGQSRPLFSPTIQYAVNELGLAVLTPNVRGSAGYGKAYLLLDNGFRREDSVRDIGALLDWITARAELNSDRLAVLGGSYGGYMVLACMMHYHDRLRAAIEMVGISNFVTFLENTQAYRRDQRRQEYGDEREPEMREFLTRISPTTNAAKIKKPLLIGQGLNDPRVPVSESEQMVEVIRKNGGAVSYVLAKDEGHGFRKKTNRDYFECATALFLEQFLL